MSRRRWLGLALALVGATAAQSQQRWREHAVPYVTPPVFVAMQSAHWYQPRATEWLLASHGLQRALQADCSDRRDWSAARRAWQHSMVTWVRLSTIAVGPLVERRSARRVDFQPTRPEAIRKALAQSALGSLDAQLLGSAAKGLPALEWLLWSADAPLPQVTACRLAALVAQDLLDEARALDGAFHERARQPATDEAAVVEQMSEAVNQWLGGIEQFRMQAIVRPLAEAQTRRLRQAQLPRILSAQSHADRTARWSALRALALFDSAVAPPAGSALVPLETMLRGTGRNALADRLLQYGKAVDAAMSTAQGSSPGELQRLAQALAALRQLVEDEIAPSLDIRIGFSDADGD